MPTIYLANQPQQRTAVLLQTFTALLISFLLVISPLAQAREELDQTMSRDQVKILVASINEIVTSHYLHGQNASGIKADLSLWTHSLSPNEPIQLDWLLDQLQQKLAGTEIEIYRQVEVKPSQQHIYSEHLDELQYIAMRGSFNSDRTRAELMQALQKLQKAKPLILDIRHAETIDEETLSLLASYLLPSNTVLGTLQTNTGYRELAVASASNTNLQLSKENFVIAYSHFNAGLWELLMSALQSDKAVTLIGEPSLGVDTISATHALPYSLSLTLPYGQLLPRAQAVSWQQTGVDPDIQVAAKQALAQAYNQLIQAASN